MEEVICHVSPGLTKSTCNLHACFDENTNISGREFLSTRIWYVYIAESSSGVQSGGRKSLIYVLVAVIKVLVVVAGVGWGLYVTKVPGPTLSQKENQVTALAYQHWQAIGVENLSQTISQYSSSSVLYWNVK